MHSGLGGLQSCVPLPLHLSVAQNSEAWREPLEAWKDVETGNLVARGVNGFPLHIVAEITAMLWKYLVRSAWRS